MQLSASSHFSALENLHMNFDLQEFWASVVTKNKYEPTKISLR